MTFRFYATFQPKPGKSIPLVFSTAAARDAFVSAHPTTARAIRAAAAPKRSVCNVRNADQIGGR